MSFQPFQILKNILNPKRMLSSGGFTTANSSNVKGAVNFTPANVKYLQNSKIQSGTFSQYPLDARDQEHYILIDIIKRIPDDGNTVSLENTSATLNADNLRDVVFTQNRFFNEGGKALGVIPTGKGSKRRVKHTLAFYIPSTVKFQFAADYGAAEIGNLLGLSAKAKDFFSAKGGVADIGAALSQVSKGLEGGIEFLSLGGLAGAGAGIQRRTGVAPAAMTEMIFNGIDYRTFSFEFKFTPRSRAESTQLNQMLHYIKESMLPEKFGTGSIAAFTVPDEFVVRFMQGTKINRYLDQVGLCACTGVDISYGGDKFSTHAYGDPVTIDVTLTFRELELIERQRYNQLRNSAIGANDEDY